MIKAVIFDVGGVLVDYDIASNIRLFSEELNTDIATAEKIFLVNIMNGLSLGMNEEDFWHQVSEEFQLRKVTPHEQLLRRTFEKTIKPIDSMLEFVESLKQRNLELAILSDTTAPHAEALTDIGVYDSFKHKVLSYEVNMRKPEPAIFEYALKLLAIKPNEAIFVDDVEKNIAGAQAVGIQGVLAKNSAQVQHDILQLLTQ